MEFRKRIQIIAWEEETRQKIISFWQEHGVVFANTQGDILQGQRGSMWGNLTSFDMSKLMATLTVSRMDEAEIECVLEIDTYAQYITSGNKAYWQREMDTFESWLLRGDKKELLRASAKHGEEEVASLLRPAENRDDVPSQELLRGSQEQE